MSRLFVWTVLGAWVILSASAAQGGPTIVRENRTQPWLTLTLPQPVGVSGAPISGESGATSFQPLTVVFAGRAGRGKPQDVGGQLVNDRKQVGVVIISVIGNKNSGTPWRGLPDCRRAASALSDSVNHTPAGRTNLS